MKADLRVCPPGDEEDARLLGRVAGGDRQALALLYDRLAPLLRALARRMLGPGDAEDLVHDVFLEVWRNAGDHDAARAPVRLWMLMVLRSRALDRLGSARRARRATTAAMEEPRPEREDASLGPDRAAAVRALATLPPEQRRALELGYFDGLSSSEIARITEVAIGTVKSRVAAGLAKLRAALDRAGGDE